MYQDLSKKPKRVSQTRIEQMAKYLQHYQVKTYVYTCFTSKRFIVQETNSILIFTELEEVFNHLRPKVQELEKRQFQDYIKRVRL